MQPSESVLTALTLPSRLAIGVALCSLVSVGVALGPSEGASGMHQQGGGDASVPGIIPDSLMPPAEDRRVPLELENPDDLVVESSEAVTPVALTSPDVFCLEADLDFVLSGTMVGGTPNESVAILAASTPGTTAFVGPGDSLGRGYRVAAVQRGRLVLLRHHGESGHFECIRSGTVEQRRAFRQLQLAGFANDAAHHAAGMQGPMPTPTETASEGDGGQAPLSRDQRPIRRQRDGSVRVARAFVDELLTDDSSFDGLAPEVSPALDASGRPIGISLDNIPRHSPLAELGIRGGDVLVSLNGHDVRTLQGAAEILDSLRDADHASVGIVRRNVRYTMEILVD